MINRIENCLVLRHRNIQYFTAMKNKALIGILILLFPAISFAQERLEKGDDKFRYMVNELNLTAEQIALVRPIIEEYETKRQELRQALNDQMVSDNRVILSKMEKLREEVSQKLRQALTPEQLENGIVNRGYITF